MNTPTRRSFITTLLAAPAAALALSKVAAKPAPEPPNVVLASSPLPPLEWRVKGLAIKVPSNRIALPIYRGYHHPTLVRINHLYEGHWDGTFKLEAGCSNPAYILADLYERTGAEPDWAVNDVGRVTTRQGEVVSYSARPKSTWGLDWQMLYDWGQHCDELTTEWTDLNDMDTLRCHGETPHPCFTVNVFVSTPEEMITLRETLRMHCLSWQASDPRYRTSWPGIASLDQRVTWENRA